MRDKSNHALSILSDYKNWSDADKDKFVHYIMGELDGAAKAKKDLSSKLKQLGIAVPESVFTSAVT